MFVAYHFDPHSTTYHPTSPSSDPLPCSLSPTGSVLDGLGFAHPSLARQLAWPNRVHLRCGLGLSHSVAPDHASRHRPYSVLLVLSRFNNAGLSPALISAPWRTGGHRRCHCRGVSWGISDHGKIRLSWMIIPARAATLNGSLNNVLCPLE